MIRHWIPALVFITISAGAQITTFHEIPHIETALNHLTVIDLGEPISMVAAADSDSFQIEKHNDKVFILPLKDGVSTNLFIWTVSRQVSYELDPPVDVGKMNVLVRNLPQSVQRLTSETSTDQEIKQITSLALSEAMLGTEDVVLEDAKRTPHGVHVTVNQVLRTADKTYLRYTIANESKTAFRVTTPDVSHLRPTQSPISLLGLRDHQLSPQTVAAFKAAPDGAASVAAGQSQQSDLAPGQSTTGFVCVRLGQGSTPQVYQFRFGSTQSGPVTAEVVL